MIRTITTLFANRIKLVKQNNQLMPGNELKHLSQVGGSFSEERRHQCVEPDDSQWPVQLEGDHFSRKSLTATWWTEENDLA